MIPLDFTLSNQQLLLRFPNETDIDFVYSATQFKGFNDGMLWDPPKSKNELLIPLERNEKAWKKGEAFVFTILSKVGIQNRLGRISIRSTKEERVWNVGFWKHPESQKKGIMTDALHLILDFGFNYLDATKINAQYATWNLASQKVLERNGFRFVKFVENGFQKNGKWVDENEVEISKSEFLKTYITN